MELGYSFSSEEHSPADLVRNPSIVAHAAATTACLMPGRFFLGVGTGENLNEHVLGAKWPAADDRPPGESATRW